MTNTQYFIIGGTKDGRQIDMYSEEEMRDLLRWNDDEKCIEMAVENGCNRFVDFDDIDDIDDCDGAYIVIKGEVVIPKEKKTVVEYEL